MCFKPNLELHLTVKPTLYMLVSCCCKKKLPANKTAAKPDTNCSPANAGLQCCQSSSATPEDSSCKSSWWCFCFCLPPQSERVRALWLVPVDAEVFHVSKKRLNPLSINLLLWALYLVIMIKSSASRGDGPPTNTRSESLLILYMKVQPSKINGETYGKVNNEVMSLLKKEKKKILSCQHWPYHHDTEWFISCISDSKYLQCIFITWLSICKSSILHIYFFKINT